MNFKIDELDAVIVSILLLDARTSFVKIAKFTQTSTNTIRTRYTKLKEKGVITGSTIQVRPKTLGHNCMGQIFIHTDFNEENDFCKKILKIPGVVNCNFQIGEFNYVIFFSLENISELDTLVGKVNQHPNIKRTCVDVYVGEINADHPKNLVIEPLSNSVRKKINETFGSSTTNKTNNQDSEDKIIKKNKIDYDIINLLLKDARISLRKIAKKLSVSNQTILKRYERLKKTVIQNSTITISLEKIGYFGIAIFGLKLSTEYPASTIFKKVLSTRNVIIAYRTLGEFQIIAGVPFKKMDELESHYITISKMPSVIEVKLFLPKMLPEWPVNTFSQL
jgi:Lrp/AsnC family transcriptional regulator, regulator for asnA, asnC and gidA